MKKISDLQKILSENTKSFDLNLLSISEDTMEELILLDDIELFKELSILTENMNGDIESFKYKKGFLDGYRMALEQLTDHFRDIETCEAHMSEKERKTFTAEKIADMIGNLLK